MKDAVTAACYAQVSEAPLTRPDAAYVEVAEFEDACREGEPVGYGDEPPISIVPRARSLAFKTRLRSREVLAPPSAIAHSQLARVQDVRQVAGSEAVQGKVFVSYRRDDSQGSTGRLYDRLVKTLGRNAIFFDIESITPGVDFVHVLKSQVGSCNALLAVIGSRWVSMTNSYGERRLDDSADFVRIEVETALERNIPVIPVLVDGARMPTLDELPASLKGLTRRQALEISHARFDFDADRLFKGIRQALDNSRLNAKRDDLADIRRPVRLGRLAQVIAGVSTACLLVIGFLTIWNLQTNHVIVKERSQPISPDKPPSPASDPIPAAVPVAPAAPIAPPPSNPAPDKSSDAAPKQSEVNRYCRAYSFDGILRTQNAGLGELETYRSNLIAGKSRFTPMMNPNDAANSLGYSSLFSTFYGEIEESMPDGYGDRPVKIGEVTNRIDTILQDERKMVKIFSEEQFQPAVTYLWLFEQGSCLFPGPLNPPTATQMLEAVASKNLLANFSNSGERVFKSIYDHILSSIIDKHKINGYWSFWTLSRDWRLQIVNDLAQENKH